MQDRKTSSEGLKSESLVEIPTRRVRFPYPAWTGSGWILFFLPISGLFLGPAGHGMDISRVKMPDRVSIIYGDHCIFFYICVSRNRSKSVVKRLLDN